MVAVLDLSLNSLTLDSSSILDSSPDNLWLHRMVLYRSSVLDGCLVLDDSSVLGASSVLNQSINSLILDSSSVLDIIPVLDSSSVLVLS